METIAIFCLVIVAVVLLVRIIKNRLPEGFSIHGIVSTYIKFLTAVGEMASSKLDPESEFIEKGRLRATVSSFWAMDSSHTDLKLLTGGISIKNSTDQLISVGQVTLSSSAGIAKALTQPEIETAIKGAPLLAKFYGGAREEMMRSTLASMGRTSAASSQPPSIAGQTVQANQTGNFAVCFLIPKNMPKEFTLQIESIGSVVLSESLPEID